ncbi:hypothetical protein PanWU01x14_157170 [Parasponia andersonii]|uniref:Uncharacterized protein n=1 Tax=Parasponia andersonii TaxID=3476 RepID=A0A2P5CFK4_PARAD|nr:hypothetical protein PanWU01x14_157170 [Parasponia andersonii]
MSKPQGFVIVVISATVCPIPEVTSTSLGLCLSVFVQIVKSCSHAKHNIRNSKPDLDNLGKDEEQVLAPKIIDPCPHAKHRDSGKLEQHLANLEKHRDKDWTSEVPNSDKQSFEENVACIEKINELIYRQQKQVRTYKGFHIDEDLRDLGGGLILPVDLDDEFMNKIVKDSAVFAAEKYNQTEVKDLELERVVKANSKLVGILFDIGGK